MTTVLNTPAIGTVFTFYSFKGGAGRSMALANVAALLAKRGKSVLVVDWDLEAPGLERYFFKYSDELRAGIAEKPGIVDLVLSAAAGTGVDWQSALHEFKLPVGASVVSLISAGKRDNQYATRLHSVDFERLFSERELGSYIERLRNEWISQFEYVLIDSRTGVTDIGGICTVQLADILVFLVTTTDSSVFGVKAVIEQARVQQQRLPVDRRRLLAIPVPARDESRAEYRRAGDWKLRFAKEFKDLFEDWLPTAVSAGDALEVLKLPYVPYWSFGEELPVIEEGVADPSSLGFAFNVLSLLIESRLSWPIGSDGGPLASIVTPSRTELDPKWIASQQVLAKMSIQLSMNEAVVSKNAFMEITHGSFNPFEDRTPQELLDAARVSAVHTSGWPVGVVVENNLGKPSPRNDGIVAVIESMDGGFDYWSLRKNGDFFTLMSLFEDERLTGAIVPKVRILRTAEALIHCGNLHKSLGSSPSMVLALRVSYRGIKSRTIYWSTVPSSQTGYQNLIEDAVEASVTFRLSSLESELVSLVKALCKPLFVLFGFLTIDDKVYQKTVSDFVAGRID